MLFLCYCILPGSTEGLVRCGVEIKYVLIAYFLRNIFAKNYQKLFTCVVRVIARQSSDICGTQCTMPFINDEQSAAAGRNH